MGNCLTDKDLTPLEIETKPEAQEKVAQKYNIYEACTKKITYIKKYYDKTITAEQKRRLGFIEKVIDQMKLCSQKMDLTEEQQDVCFGSINQELKKMKSRAENTAKLPLTDYEAFLRKVERLKINKIDLFQILSIPKSTTIAPTLEDLKDINFPILGFSINNLTYLAGLVMKNTDFVAENFIKSSRIDSFVESISINYNITSYHNFSHGFSVFLMAYQAYNLSRQIKHYLNSQQIFFLLIAALGHDLNHKGRNNAYYIKKKSHYAKVYANQAVLQNMHISTLFRIMDENPDGNLIECLKDPASKAKARKIIIKAILATDMTTHFSGLKVLKQKCEASEEALLKTNDKVKYLSFQKQRQEDREIILENIIHACDIGNPCLQYQNYLNWAILLTHQFNQQHKREAYYEYELTPMLQYTDKAGFYKGQIGFCRHFVLPLWKQMSTFSNALKVFSDQIEENINKLEQIK